MWQSCPTHKKNINKNKQTKKPDIQKVWQIPSQRRWTNGQGGHSAIDQYLYSEKYEANLESLFTSWWLGYLF